MAKKYNAASAARRVSIAVTGSVANDAAGALANWQNPEGQSIEITRLSFNATVIATAACTLDGGTTATSAATLSDNMIDGADVHSATGLFTNLTDAGANGKTGQLLAADKWVTLSTASGASLGLVGTLTIDYQLLSA